MVALLILLLLVVGLIAGGWALKNRFFPAAPEEDEPTEAQSSGPTEEELANPELCATEALELHVELAADSLPAGQTSNIPVTIRNTGEVPCLQEVGKGAIEVNITSGDDPVWSSRHCSSDLPSERQLLLDADASDTTVLAWDGARSADGCSSDQPKVKPGTYRLHVAVTTETGTLEQEQVFGVHD